MVEKLPPNLLDETGQTIQHVVQAKLPAENWHAVKESLQRVDAAVQAGEANALRDELNSLREAATHGPVITAGFASGPAVAQEHTRRFISLDRATRARRSGFRWVLAAIIAVVVVPVAVALMLIATKGETHNATSPTFSTTVMPPPTGTASTIPTTMSPTPSAPISPPIPAKTNNSSGFVIAGVIGAIALVAALVFVMVNVSRRRARKHSIPTHFGQMPRPPQVAPPQLLPAPREVVEYANQTVLILGTYGSDR